MTERKILSAQVRARGCCRAQRLPSPLGQLPRWQARIKYIDSPVAGAADVLAVPNIEAI
jgi:hypothetical protein